MVRPAGTGPTDPRLVPPPPPPPPPPPKKKPEPAEGQSNAGLKDTFKDSAGDILDNAGAVAKVLRMTSQMGLADELVGKVSRGLDMVTELPKGVAGHVRNIAGQEPKAPVGMRGSLTERKEGFKVKKGPDGKLRLTRGSKFSMKANRALEKVPGVKQMQSAVSSASQAIDNSQYAKNTKLKAGELSKKYFDKADELGKKAASSSGAKKVAAKLGGQTAKTAGKLALKSAGRFAPGANVAIAAVDWYTATKTLSDPKASGWKKGTKLATAVFSTVAATNIPIVSQVGAGLSLATDLASNINPGKAVEGAKNLAKGAGDLAKKGLNKAKDFIGGL